MNSQLENIKLKKQLSQYRQANNLLNYVDDSTVRGGYKVVKSIQERDAIDTCHRKIGMIVAVQESPTEYTSYRLIDKNTWVEVTTEGIEGPPGEVSLLNFHINSDMELIMELETNTNLDFHIDDEGYFKVTI